MSGDIEAAQDWKEKMSGRLAQEDCLSLMVSQCCPCARASLRWGKDMFAHARNCKKCNDASDSVESIMMAIRLLLAATSCGESQLQWLFR